MITYLVMWILTDSYGCWAPGIRKAIQWPTRESFKGWGEYLAISCGSTVMMLAEGWAFNILGVLAGLISVTDQAVNTILFQFIAVMFMVPNGLQSACAAIIGEQIGANNVSLAKRYFRMMSICTIVFMLILQAMVYVFRSELVRVFTNDEAVYELAKQYVYIIVLVFTADMIQGTI